MLCPLDQHPLSWVGNSLLCPQGHSFDRARSGYVNLLPVQHKHSRDPGDSKEMVAARREFLNGGSYRPIADALWTGVHAHFSSSQPMTVFDAGCGEGYYLDHLVSGLREAGYTVAAQGLDISKWAVTAASKRNSEIGWIVGSNAALPTPAARFDLLLCLFGYPVFSEFARVLKPDGLLLMADAGPDHLIELRRVLYPEIHPYRDHHAGVIDGFEPLEEQVVRFEFELTSGAAIGQLLAMTPHLHKAPFAGREAAQALERIRLTADVRLRSYRLCG
nr:methyltransferase domain-containing protein [Motiliproteus sediminis]